MGEAWARISSPARTPREKVSPPFSRNQPLPCIRNANAHRGTPSSAHAPGMQGDAVLSLRRKP